MKLFALLFALTIPLTGALNSPPPKREVVEIKKSPHSDNPELKKFINDLQGHGAKVYDVPGTLRGPGGDENVVFLFVKDDGWDYHLMLIQPDGGPKVVIILIPGGFVDMRFRRLVEEDMERRDK